MVSVKSALLGWDLSHPIPGDAVKTGQGQSTGHLVPRLFFLSFSSFHLRKRQPESDTGNGEGARVEVSAQLHVSPSRACRARLCPERSRHGGGGGGTLQKCSGIAH